MKDNDLQHFPYSVDSSTVLTHLSNDFGDSRLSRICHAEFKLLEEIPVSKRQVDFLIQATFVRAPHNNYDDDRFLPTNLSPDQILFAEFIKSPESTQIIQTIKTSYKKTPYQTWVRDLDAEGLVRV